MGFTEFLNLDVGIHLGFTIICALLGVIFIGIGEERHNVLFFIPGFLLFIPLCIMMLIPIVCVIMVLILVAYDVIITVVNALLA